MTRGNLSSMLGLAILQLSFAACSSGGTGGGDTTAPVIEVTSPSARYYLADPTLEYTVSEEGERVVTLDGIVVGTESGEPLPAVGTGWHTLRVRAWDASDNEASESVVFFVNKLTQVQSDDFDRADGTDVGDPPWQEWSTGADILRIAGQRLVSTGSTDPEITSAIATGQVSTDTECIQKLDVVGMTHANAELHLSLSQSASNGAVYAFLKKLSSTETSSSYELGVQQWTPLGGMVVVATSAADVVVPTSSEPISLIQYQDGTHYAALVIDAAGAILGKADNPSYAFSPGGAFDARQLQFFPRGDAGAGVPVIATDNYRYFH